MYWWDTAQRGTWGQKNKFLILETFHLEPQNSGVFRSLGTARRKYYNMIVIIIITSKASIFINLLWARSYTMCFICIFSFNPYEKPMRQVL